MIVDNPSSIATTGQGSSYGLASVRRQCKSAKWSAGEGCICTWQVAPVTTLWLESVIDIFLPTQEKQDEGAHNEGATRNDSEVRAQGRSRTYQSCRRQPHTHTQLQARTYPHEFESPSALSAPHHQSSDAVMLGINTHTQKMSNLCIKWF